MGLFGPNFYSLKFDEKAAKKVDEMTDQKKLKDIVILAKNVDMKYRAFNRITDEEMLYEIAMEKNLTPLQLGYDAVSKIKDKKIIDRFIKEITPTHRYFGYIYDNIENPSFEISIQMHSKKAEENLIKNLSEMKYPEDRDKIIETIKKTNMFDLQRKALDMLPYETEKEYLKSLFEKTDSIFLKQQIIFKLPLKEERDFFEKILYGGSKSGVIIKTIGTKLDKDDPLLDKEVCPKCGAIESMHLFDEYRRSIDLNVRGYCCNKCNYESLEQTGLGEVKNPKVTLREFIKIK